MDQIQPIQPREKQHRAGFIHEFDNAFMPRYGIIYMVKKVYGSDEAAGLSEFGFMIKDDLDTYYVEDTGIRISSELHSGIFKNPQQTGLCAQASTCTGIAPCAGREKQCPVTTRSHK